MRVPLSWLKDFAPVEADTPALVDAFNELGLVVDGVTEIQAVDEGVVVARVLNSFFQDGEAVPIRCCVTRNSPARRITELGDLTGGAGGVERFAGLDPGVLLEEAAALRERNRMT